MNCKIAIILLNYNNARDTIHAIDSIIKNEDAERHSLFVVDNNSTDGSYNEILNHLQHNHSVEYLVEGVAVHKYKSIPTTYLLSATENNGYAAGNNIGIRAAIKDSSIGFVWILNNDVELKNDCIFKIEEALRKHNGSKAVWSTLLVNYYDRNTIQALAGRYFPLFAKTMLRLPNYQVSDLSNFQIDRELRRSNYLIGASLLFKANFFAEVGVFNEAFFLYSEETDLFQRARVKGYAMKVIKDAVVYHKEGGTTNSNAEPKRSPFIEYHNSRSKIIFTKLHFRMFYPVVFFLIVGHIFWRYRGNLGNAFRILRHLLKGKRIVKQADF